MRVILLFILSIIHLTLSAQEKYWIFLKDKNTNNYNYWDGLSTEAIHKRQSLGIPLYQYSDVPVNQDYINDLKQSGITSIHASKWLNAVSATLLEKQKHEVLSKPYVLRIQPIITGTHITQRSGVFSDEDYLIPNDMMQVNAFTDQELSGKGVRIGVIDAGFYHADAHELLTHIYDEERVIATKDFVGDNDDGFYNVEPSDDHGTDVFTFIAGKKDSLKYGLALDAEFVLARSEDISEEVRLEEDNWIAALEWADSLGVRMITTSLGYSLFDDGSGYGVDNMDGETAVLSKVATMAVKEKGIFIIVAAGNEGGNENWEVLLSPADSKYVLAVGASSFKGGKMGYSSIGPDYLDCVKPDIVIFSRFGTSFAAPKIAGFVACLLQMNPSVDNLQLLDIIRKSGNLFPYGNNYIGYGIPNAKRAMQIGGGKDVKQTKIVKAGRNKCKVRIDEKRLGSAAIFHKKDGYIVTKQDYLSIKKGKIKVDRYRNAATTTVVTDECTFEINWKE